MWVENAVTWQWWVFVLLTISIGVVVGWWARGVYIRQMEDDEWDDAQRAARIYHREVEAARRRHPSHG